MAYTKKTWVNGEVIDAAKLNNIETGINEAIQKANSSGGTGGAVPVNHASADTTYGMATEEMYGHARAYTYPYYPADDEEALEFVAPDGSSFEFGVPSGYFPDMAFFSALNRMYGMMFEDIENEFKTLSEAVRALQGN